MAELDCNIENYLLKWIGAVGQLLGLRLPHAMLADHGGCFTSY